jgi:hypothetical protein
MNAKRAIGSAIVGLAAPLLALSFAGTGVATAASISSTIAAVDSCSWQISSVPVSLPMTPTIAGSKFDGNKLDVSGSIPGLTIGLAGTATPETAITGLSSECSFYNAIKNAKIDLELFETDTFQASYVDADGVTQSDNGYLMKISDSNPLNFIITGGSESCAAQLGMFQGSPVGLTGLVPTPSNPAATGMVGTVGWTDWVAGRYVAGEAPRCTATYTFSMYMPGVGSGASLEGYGFSYTFTGPQVSFVLSQN